MHLKRKNGRGIFVTIPRVTQDRLSKTCFRGRDKRLGGNFSIWTLPHDVILDPVIQAAFLESVETALKKGLAQNHICVEYGRTVGWTSTDNASRYAPSQLETFSPNRHSTGLRVKADQVGLRAPKTKKVTVIYELAHIGGKPVVIIRSMYPGRYVGKLDGDISARESCVFFGWDHPGEI